MKTAATRRGLLHGTTITLETTVPPFEGKRVYVVIEPLEDQAELSAQEQKELWQNWVQKGPQGPISDEDDLDFP